MQNFLKWEYPSSLELIRYARRNPKLLRVKQRDSLIKVNYTQRTQAKRIWNPYTVMARGIIINSNTGEIIAYPFRKFFNFFEYKEYGIKLPKLPYEVTQKCDGVMIIPYPYKETLCLSSRGEFQNDYIKKAEKIQYFDWLDLENYTFMFELISPSYSKLQNKSGFLVTKYDTEDLILVGMRENQTNALLMPTEVIQYAQKNDLHHFSLVDLTLQKLSKICTRFEKNTEEGWVITYQNGFMVKLKRLEHIHYFASIKEITEKTILRALLQNQYESFKQTLPEELQSFADMIHDKIIQKRDAFVEEVIRDFNAIPEALRNDRKQFFLMVKDFKKYKKSKQKNKTYASALKIYYTKGRKEALYQHFYRYIYPSHSY